MHHRIHCVAFVVDANNDPDYPMTENVQEQIKKAQEIMNQKVCINNHYLGDKLLDI